MDRFCKDCRHHLSAMLWGDALCSRPRSIGDGKKNMVTGEVDQENYESCFYERYTAKSGFCGPSGQFFKPKFAYQLRLLSMRFFEYIKECLKIGSKRSIERSKKSISGFALTTSETSQSTCTESGSELQEPTLNLKPRSET